MGNKRLFWALAFFCSYAPAYAAINVGIVRLNDDGRAYLYTDQKVTAGADIYFQFPDAQQHENCCAKGRLTSPTADRGDRDAVNYRSDRPLYRYRLVPPKDLRSDLPFLGIAVIGKGIELKQSSAASLLVSSRKDSANLSICTSSEGVHVLSRQGEHVTSHLYLYLGYDLANPTCQEADIK